MLHHIRSSTYLKERFMYLQGGAYNTLEEVYIFSEGGICCVRGSAYLQEGVCTFREGYTSHKERCMDCQRGIRGTPGAVYTSLRGLYVSSWRSICHINSGV